MHAIRMALIGIGYAILSFAWQDRPVVTGFGFLFLAIAFLSWALFAKTKE